MIHIIWLIFYNWCSSLETFWNFKQNASPRAKKILNELIDRDPPIIRLGILLFWSMFGVDAGDMVRGSLFIEEQQFYTYGKQYSAATDDSL